MSWKPEITHEKLVTERFDDELLVYAVDRRAAHSLDENAASVLNACNGRRTLDEIARLTEIDVDRVEDIALALLDVKLVQQDKLVSRQRAFKGATAFVATIAVPLAASCIKAGQNCVDPASCIGVCVLGKTL